MEIYFTVPINVRDFHLGVYNKEFNFGYYFTFFPSNSGVTEKKLMELLELYFCTNEMEFCSHMKEVQ